MATILNNNFTNDSYGLRLERLATIQSNLGTIQPELGAPAEIVTWAATCFDNFSNLITQKDAEMSESDAATLQSTEKGRILEEEFQNCRTFYTTFLKSQPFRLQELKLDVEFPTERQMKIKKAEHILEIDERQTGEGVTPNLPAGLKARLINAIEEYRVALNAQDVESEQASYAVLKVNQAFETDTEMLQKLRSWWYIILGKRDPRISIIGMVNPETGGRPSKKLNAPTNLVFNYSSKTLWWDAVENATSYQLQWFDGTDFVEIYSGSDDHYEYTPPDGLNKFKVRARNDAGYSPWSDELQQYYFEVLPKAVNLQIVQSGTIPTDGELTWDAVPTAFNYKVYQSVDNLGEYAAHWLVIGTVTEPSKSVALTLGKRNSFKVETNNTYQTSMSDPVYIEV